MKTGMYDDAKIYKVSCYVIDPFGEGNVEKMLNANGCHTQHLHVQEASIPDFTADHHLCYKDCDIQVCDEFFPVQFYDVPNRPIPVKGETYLHFKGNRIEVEGVYQDTENVGTYRVGYHYVGKDGVLHRWGRPLGMFLSDMDREKYTVEEFPQQHRFERTNDPAPCDFIPFFDTKDLKLTEGQVLMFRTYTSDDWILVRYTNGHFLDFSIGNEYDGGYVMELGGKVLC